VIEECHRSIYNLWKRCGLFDAFLIGLTATPTCALWFFNENVVSEYSYEDVLADGVNEVMSIHHRNRDH
jgi:type I restriction enzyme R subunit